MHFVFVFEGGRLSIPFIRPSKQGAADLVQQWMDVKPLCSTKQEDFPFALLIALFQSVDASMSFEWPHYFFLLNWVRVGLPFNANADGATVNELQCTQ